MENKKDERSLAERVCRKKDPEMEELKQAILNIFNEAGGSLYVFQVEETLAKAGITIHEDSGDKKSAKVKMALSELGRECELYPEPCYDDHTGQIAVFSFSPIKKILSEDVLEVSIKDTVKAAEEEDTKTF